MELLRKIFVKYRACLCKTEQWITQKHDVHSAYIPGSFTINTTLLCGVYEKQTTNQNKTYGHVTNQNAEIQTTWLVMTITTWLVMTITTACPLSYKNSSMMSWHCTKCVKIADNGGFNYGASKHRAGKRVWIISLDVKWRGRDIRVACQVETLWVVLWLRGGTCYL